MFFLLYVIALTLHGNQMMQRFILLMLLCWCLYGEDSKFRSHYAAVENLHVDCRTGAYQRRVVVFVRKFLLTIELQRHL